MKSRYIFYLLCFLICIEWSFCYEVITNDAIKVPARQTRKKLKIRHRRNKVRNRSRRQQPRDHLVDHLDVASFIQQPDVDLSVDQQIGHYDRCRQRSRTSNDYSGYAAPSAKAEKKSLQNDIPEKQYGYYDFLEKSPTNKPSQLRSRNFPFFSHDQVDNKKKKRKLFGFRSKTTTKVTQKPKLNRPRFRRSNIFCSNCKKKSTKQPKNNNNKDKTSTIMLHNSRQFYLFNDLAKSKQKAPADDVSDCKVGRNHHINTLAQNIKDRQSTTINEIDELEERIDNLSSEARRKYENKEFSLSDSIHTNHKNAGYDNNRKRRYEDDFLTLEQKDDANKVRQFEELQEIERKVKKVRIQGYPDLDSIPQIKEFRNHQFHSN